MTHPTDPAPDGLDPRTGTTAEGEHPLFPGDTGRLPLVARRALVLLLKNTHLTARRHPEEWSALLAHRATITQICHDLFLDPVVDETTGVAWKAQATAEGDTQAYTLLRNTRLAPTEMRLLLHLRGLLMQFETDGREAPTVTGADLLAHLYDVTAASSADQVRDRDRAKQAVRALVRDDVLLAPRGEAASDPEDVTYEISPVVESLLTPDRLAAYAAALRADAAAAGLPPEDEADAPPPPAMIEDPLDLADLDAPPTADPTGPDQAGDDDDR